MWRCKQAILMYTQHNTKADPFHPTCPRTVNYCFSTNKSGVFRTRYEHEGPTITVTSNVCNYSCFFHRYSRVLRGDLAAEWGTNSGEGRRRARCVGGNFLLRATRHLLNVYIVSGSGSRRCLPVPRGSQWELSHSAAWRKRRVGPFVPLDPGANSWEKRSR